MQRGAGGAPAPHCGTRGPGRAGTGGVSIESAARIPRRPGGEFPAAAVHDALRVLAVPRRVALGFSGKGLMLRYTSVPPVPPWRLRMLVEYEIGEDMARGGSDVAYDYRPLNLSTGLGGGVEEGMVVLAAVAKIAALESAFGEARSAGVRPREAIPAAVALYRGYAASHDYKEGEVALLLDVGRENVEIAIQRDGELLFARSGSGSGTGEKVTQGVDGALGIGRDRAEDYKRSKVRLSLTPPADADRRQLSVYSTLREAGEALVGAVTGALRFAGAQTKIKDLDCDRVVLSGGGAKLAGLKEFLENRLRKPVTLYDSAAALDSSRMEARSASAFDGAPSSMAVATGLAIADAERGAPGRFELALLPPREAARREFWGRKAFARAAAALAVALAATMVVGSRLEVSSARTEREALERRLASLDARAAAAKALEGGNSRRREELLPLVVQARLNRAFLEFLPILRRTCPPGLSLMHLETLPQDAATDTVDIVLEGQGTGLKETDFIDRLDEFRAALEGSPGVVRVHDMQKRAARRRSRGTEVHGFRCELTLRPWARRPGGGEG